ncbi:arylesterase [Thalassospira lucentensis]|uniref:arylesterase n=1 Tax=Thalassospira lucentensis TaxID=168935 RepID=UPI003AA87C80
MNFGFGQGRTVIKFTAKRVLRAVAKGARASLLTIAMAIGVGAVALSSPANAADKDAKTLVLFGDSLMAGYGLNQDEGFAPQLQSALNDRGYNVNVVNSSVSGDTTAAGLARLDWALVEKPDAVLLELGANDALRGVEPSQTRDNLAQIIEKLKAQGIDVLLAGMMSPPNMGADYRDEFDSIYPDLAGRYDLDLYPFFLDGVVADPDLNLDDGMHPNPQGVKEIVGRILPDVISLLSLDPKTALSSDN